MEYPLSQDIIFDLGNVLNQDHDGYFNTTLAATFFMEEDAVVGRNSPADLIIPISTRDATGLADEEFWWSNVLQSKVDTFKETTGSIPGLSPFREVQVLIDGLLASVQWPFPVIFTGGVVPSLHRPIVGLQAFDIREHQIDITPWLPLLCDGKEHTFTIRVIGVEDNKHSCHLSESVSDSWAEYDYPLYCETITELDHAHGSSTTLGRLTEGLTLHVEGSAVFSTGIEAFKDSPGAEVAKCSGSRLETTRNGTATFSQANDGSYSLGSGITNQVFYFGGFNDTAHTEFYFRNVTTVGEGIISDNKRLVGAPSTDLHFNTQEPGESHKERKMITQSLATQVGPRAFMGRSQFAGGNGSRYFPLVQNEVEEN
ncbi:putative peptide-n4-(n-acetyl-beta-glucosaminyl)asparagine amidase a protein [Eutypa lata UCREL1]|uniref:Putative peptide-n4-(N-acetyl-beta-glucosaminyl)asparagine amidase a protein n=1 Tax=Eutypa lata (strain UCR-EL1) TaxID=1287681 RepID=M7TW33_EUTLA|nr:putative peptide-n4-(n-acetyl-beta-glucosaminyl)asparagine amidase a protein [Eutypa lata UCREL1]